LVNYITRAVVEFKTEMFLYRND